MKKNLLAVTVASALLATATVASASAPNTYYFGLKGGFANADFNINQPANVKEDDSSGINYGIFAGYNFNEYFGLEIGYNMFTGFATKDAAVDVNTSYDYKIHGPELVGRLSYPLTDTGTDIFFRGGVMYAFGDSDMSATTNKLSPVAGIGVQFMPTDNFGVRVGYDRYFNIYDGGNADQADHNVDIDLNNVYISAFFAFGGAPEPAPAPAPASKTVTANYTLDANTTFGFDSAELNDNGREAIRKVVDEARSFNLKFVKYKVDGYSDPIGNDTYNFHLSQRRADSVSAELVKLGVPAGDIVAAGHGESVSIVGDKCDKLKGKAKTECFAVERRVEVTVSGTKSEVVAQ